MIYQESITNASTFIRLAGKIKQVRTVLLLNNYLRVLMI